jgi:hypothetical protein
VSRPRRVVQHWPLLARRRWPRSCSERPVLPGGAWQPGVAVDRCLSIWCFGYVASGRYSTRPVLKHGPRSLTCAQVKGTVESPWRNESKGIGHCPQVRSPASGWGAAPARSNIGRCGAAQERTRWDPKDGELCLSRKKPEETLVEVRSDSDVQIDRRT